jgi:hypothetical protein
MKKSFALSALALAVCAGFASANPIIESESNNTAATANFVGAFGVPGGSVLIDGTITSGGPAIAGDVDWFRFTVGGTTTVVTSVFSLDNAFADSELWLVAADGTTILDYNDDGNTGGGGRMSSLMEIGLAPGSYYLALSGFNDGGALNTIPDGFVGSNPPPPGGGQGHGQNFTYNLLIGFNIVPSPAAIALFGMGGLAMTRRRR